MSNAETTLNEERRTFRVRVPARGDICGSCIASNGLWEQATWRLVRDGDESYRPRCEHHSRNYPERVR